jgi:FkbM family methyltransferase
MSLLRITGALPVSWLKAISRAQWRHPLLKRSFDWAANHFRNQDGTIQQGVGRGLLFNTGRSNAGYMLGTTEPRVQHAFASLIQPRMVVYDIGANVGFFTVIAARLSPQGRVVAFEPLPENSERIRHNVALNNLQNIIVRTEALSDTDAQARFQVSPEPTWGKLASLDKGISPNVGAIDVKVSRLDSLVEAGEIPIPELIKIDVEGAETGVLRGAESTLRQARPLLLIELHGTNQPIAGLLETLGYSAAVLGDTRAVTDAPGDAYVAAAPTERADLVAAITSLREYRFEPPHWKDHRQ